MDEVKRGAYRHLLRVLVKRCSYTHGIHAGGIWGQFYKQFALTIENAAMDLSDRVLLSLTPALCAIILKPHFGTEKAHPGSASSVRAPRQALRQPSATATGSALRGRTIRASTMMLILYGGLLALAGWRLSTRRGACSAARTAAPSRCPIPVAGGRNASLTTRSPSRLSTRHLYDAGRVGDIHLRRASMATALQPGPVVPCLGNHDQFEDVLGWHRRCEYRRSSRI